MPWSETQNIALLFNNKNALFHLFINNYASIFVTGEAYWLIFRSGGRVIRKVFESTFRNRFRLSVPRFSNE